jgi:hypothetical protein
MDRQSAKSPAARVVGAAHAHAFDTPLVYDHVFLIYTVPY